MSLDMHRVAELETFLLELNHASARVITPLFRGAHGMKDKGGPRGFDPVTTADRDAEAVIRQLVAERYPDHGVIGEEYGSDRPDAEWVWVLDPIDGTRAFVAGLPLWTTLIALRHEGKPVLGSIGQAFLREIYIGHVGPNARARLVTPEKETPLRVRACASIPTAVVASTDPNTYFTAAERAAWMRVRDVARITRLGCDAYAFAMVAAGTMDLAIEAGLNAWDIESAIPLVIGAGGVVTDWKGEDVGPNGGRAVLAGDRRCLDEALAVLSTV